MNHHYAAILFFVSDQVFHGQIQIVDGLILYFLTVKYIFFAMGKSKNQVDKSKPSKIRLYNNHQKIGLTTTKKITWIC